MRDLIARLYAVERRAQRPGIKPERWLAWRQRHSRRRLAQLRAELERLSLVVLPVVRWARRSATR